jgi:hypothetical protein
VKLALLTLFISVFANSMFGGTFGYTSVGATKYKIRIDEKQGSKFDLLEAADIDSILFWGRTGGGAPSPTVVKCAIYRDNAGLPDAWIATTQEITINSTLQWWSAKFSSAVSLDPGSYWLVAHSGTKLDMYGDAGATNQRANNSDIYSDGLADPFGPARQDDVKLSIYALYTQAPLPIQLAYMNATVIVNTNDVRITWGTITETNNYGFYVQQSIGNTTSFADLPNSFVPGQGTTLIPHDYSWTYMGVAPGTYYYRIKQVDLDGTTHYTDAVQVIVDGVTSVDNKTIPQVFTLAQNYPNPFNPSTTIQFTVETGGHTTLTVFNALGQEIATLFSGDAESGQVYTTKFDATDLANGMYFYTLVNSDQSSIKKMVLLK